MPLTKEKAKENLTKLIEKFRREKDAEKIYDYNEEATKTAFIQPLLRDVLGWDVSDRDEVSPEENISRGRVDYGLKIDGKTKIFVEAKPPKVDLSKEGPISQAIQYGYNRKGVPFVLLTDFEEFKLFDVTIKPNPRNLRKGLKLDLLWDKYLDNFDKLWLISRESVAKGELDSLLLAKPKERFPVDKAILDDLKEWRETLARDIFKNNPKLFNSGDREKDAVYLKEITQKIIDRIIFMRSCEDRGLVSLPPLKNLFEDRTDNLGTDTMVFLKEEFRHYNIIFDSDLFMPQEWEEGLAVDFSVMNDIISDTYDPYQFDVIPIEVLGNIYEQYLGYTIKLTDQQVKYDLKPDIRKAGGVYYTPEYIVDYIVKNTVGKLLQELPAVKIKKLRILDPACGSGSFLIRAYDQMLEWYSDQKAEKQKPDREAHPTFGEEFKKAPKKLTIQEKSEILKTHIFGVDIDEQAVEVTKLSLMLKMLEGESSIVVGRSLLPTLDRNIRCGNSLISGDTLELKKYFGSEWYKVKPFNWDQEFKDIMEKEDGFDVVMGNPPYGAELFCEDYLKSRYPYSSKMKEINSYLYFIEKSRELLKLYGHLGFIIPDTFLLKSQYENFRKFLFEKASIYEIVETSVVFEQARATPNVLLFFSKIRSDPKNKIKRKQLDYRKNIGDILEDLRNSRWFKQGELSFEEWAQSPRLQLGRYIDDGSKAVIRKIIYGNSRVLLGRIEGIAIDRGIEGGKASLLKVREKNMLQILIPDNVNRYYISDSPQYFTKDINKSFEFDRILIIRIRNTKIHDRIVAGFEDNKRVALKTLQQIYLSCKSQISLKYILGILNSRLINYYCSHFLVDDINKEYLSQIPIRLINLSNKEEKAVYGKLVGLVNVIINLNTELAISKGNEKEQLQQQIDKTDKEIDDLVYELYGITDEERKIIESIGT